MYRYATLCKALVEQYVEGEKQKHVGTKSDHLRGSGYSYTSRRHERALWHLGQPHRTRMQEGRRLCRHALDRALPRRVAMSDALQLVGSGRPPICHGLGQMRL